MNVVPTLRYIMLLMACYEGELGGQVLWKCNFRGHKYHVGCQSEIQVTIFACVLGSNVCFLNSMAITGGLRPHRGSHLCFVGARPSVSPLKGRLLSILFVNPNYIAWALKHELYAYAPVCAFGSASSLRVSLDYDCHLNL